MRYALLSVGLVIVMCFFGVDAIYRISRKQHPAEHPAPVAVKDSGPSEVVAVNDDGPSEVIVNSNVYIKKPIPLAARYPELKSICDAAGGCEHVEVICTKYDGSGNSDLRNETFYKVRAEVNGHAITGMGWTENAKPNCHKAIAQAARDFWTYLQMFQHQEKEQQTVYPKQLP
jgi:hypothetical protein